MTHDKRTRRNIMMLDSVYAIAQELVQDRHMGTNKFSQLLSDLVLDAQKRQASGGDKSPEQYLTEIVELLAKVRVLEAKVADMKSDRSAMKSVWKRHFKEEADKKSAPGQQA